MFRTSAYIAFIIGIFALATTNTYLVNQASGSSGLPSYVPGFAMFTLIMTAIIMLLSPISDQINNSNAMLLD